MRHVDLQVCPVNIEHHPFYGNIDVYVVLLVIVTPLEDLENSPLTLSLPFYDFLSHGLDKASMQKGNSSIRNSG